MKTVYAVQADKKTISSRFARAPFFKVTEDSRVLEVIENPYVEAVPAGPETVELVARYNPDRVVAGAFGRIAAEELRKKGISFTTSTGSTNPNTQEISLEDLLPALPPLPPLPRFLFKKKK